VADIADELDGVVEDLAGLVDGLKLGGLILVDQVFVKIKSGGSQQGAGVVVEVGGQALALLFLEADGSVQQDLLLLMLQLLKPELVPDYLSLVKDDEKDQTDGQYKHAQSAHKEYKGNSRLTCSL